MNKVPCIKCDTMILPTTFKKFNGLCGRCDMDRCSQEAYERFVSSPGCQACDGSNYGCFNWENAVKRKDNKLYKYTKYIEAITPLKKGFLYQCNRCNTYLWCSDENFMYVVENIDAVMKWNETNYILPFHLFFKMMLIKPTPEDFYRNDSEYIDTPCSVITKDNLLYKNVLIRLTDFPPIRKNNDRSLHVGKIKKIQASPNVFPFSIRKADADSQEVRMCFRPVIIISKDKRIFILNGTLGFFKYDDLVGKDMRLPSDKFFKNKRGLESISYDGFDEEICCIYGDISFFQKIFLYFARRILYWFCSIPFLYEVNYK